MNISGITNNPSLLFRESFVSTEFDVHPEWETKVCEIISFCSNHQFESGLELLHLIEEASQTNFSSNNNHFINSIYEKSSTCSELLGSLLMCLAWLHSKKTFPKILKKDDLYYFLSPDGQITQVNSNRKGSLPASKKFDVISSDQSAQYDFTELIKHYFEEVCADYITNKNYDSLLKAQTYMIAFDPKEIKWFARRGLLNKRLGNFSDAVSDLKRFISFCNYEDAPIAVKNALIELEGLKATDNFSEYLIH